MSIDKDCSIKNSPNDNEMNRIRGFTRIEEKNKEKMRKSLIIGKNIIYINSCSTDSFIDAGEVIKNSLGLVSLNEFLENEKQLNHSQKYMIAYGIALGLREIKSTKPSLSIDLTPRNVFIGKDFSPFILIRKHKCESTKFVDSFSLLYDVDKKSFIYCYGIILYELFVYPHPIRKLNVLEIISNSNENMFQIPEDMNIGGCSLTFLLKMCLSNKISISRIIEWLGSSLYDQGIRSYCHQNYEEAILFFTLVPCMESYLMLGTIYFQGLDVEIDYAKAFHFFSMASEDNYDKAQVMLGYMYYYGLGVNQDHEKAAYYYSLAAEQNCAEAQHHLGNIYIETKDFSKAFHYLSLAAEQGMCIAQYNLGAMYEDVLGIEKNILNAMHFYSLAAEKNHPMAHYKLGLLYYNEENYSKAFHHITLAAEQSEVHALNHLGVLYENGKGVEQDFSKALHYYSLAAE